MRSLVLSVFLLTSSQSPAWRDDGFVDGMRVEVRDVEGSPYLDLRVTTSSSASLQSLCDAIFARGLHGKQEGRFKRRDILRETDRDRWTYEQISVPVASDRDYVMHVTLEEPASLGRCEVSFQTEDDPEHPPVPGFVRIPTVRGHWSLWESAGSTQIVYQIYSDPGGHVPPLFVRGGQRSAAIDFLKVILARAHEVAQSAQ